MIVLSILMKNYISKMEKRKFDYQLLQSRCNENNIKLLKNYFKEILSCDIIIKGECINYIQCNNLFKKKIW